MTTCLQQAAAEGHARSVQIDESEDHAGKRVLRRAASDGVEKELDALDRTIRPIQLQPTNFEGSQISRIAPFIEQMGTGARDGYNYHKEFWREREWRKVNEQQFNLGLQVVSLVGTITRVEIIGSGLASKHQIAFVALGLLIVLVAALVTLRPWPFPPSLTIDELNGFSRLNLTDPGHGADAMATFYEWRQDQWGVLARGFGALAVTLLLTLVGASIETGKTVTAEAPSPAGRGVATTITTTRSETSPAVLALVGGLVLLGGAAWLRSRALHGEFATDIGRITELP